MIKIIDDDGDFNYSRLKNLGFKSLNGSYILFLNNDISFNGDDLWIYKMMRKMDDEKDIGALGIKLLSSDRITVQCSGVVVGIGHIATNLFSGNPDNRGYYRYDSSDRDVRH